MADREYLEEESGVADVSELAERFGGKLISDTEGSVVIERPPHRFIDDQEDRLTQMIQKIDPDARIVFQDQPPGHPAQG